MVHRSSSPHAVKTDTGSVELTEELVRERAYQFYEERGREDGHDLDDWLRAEAEMLGKKPSDSAMALEVAAMSAAAA
jgi:hypothetical protein